MGNNNGDPTDDIVSRSGESPVNNTQRNVYNVAITCEYLYSIDNLSKNS